MYIHDKMISRFNVGEYWIEAVGEFVIGIKPWTIIQLKYNWERFTEVPPPPLWILAGDGTVAGCDASTRRLFAARTTGVLSDSAGTHLLDHDHQGDVGLGERLPSSSTTTYVADVWTSDVGRSTVFDVDWQKVPALHRWTLTQAWAVWRHCHNAYSQKITLNICYNLTGIYQPYRKSAWV